MGLLDRLGRLLASRWGMGRRRGLEDAVEEVRGAESGSSGSRPSQLPVLPQHYDYRTGRSQGRWRNGYPLGDVLYPGFNLAVPARTPPPF